MARFGDSSLKIKVRGADPTSVGPSDVYDIATLINSEIAQLFSRVLPEAAIPDKDYPTRIVLPAGPY